MESNNPSSSTQPSTSNRTASTSTSSPSDHPSTSTTPTHTTSQNQEQNQAPGSTTLSSNSTMEPYSDTTLANLEQRSYLGDEASNHSHQPSSTEVQPPRASASFPRDEIPGNLAGNGHLGVGSGIEGRRGSGNVNGRSSHDGDRSNTILRKPTSSSSLSSFRSRAKYIANDDPDSSRSSQEASNAPILLHSSSSSRSSYPNQRSPSNYAGTEKDGKDRSGTADTGYSALSTQDGSSSLEGSNSVHVNEGSNSGGRLLAGHHRDATITRKSVERSRSLERRRRLHEQQHQQSQRMEPPSFAGASSTSLGATSVGSGHAYGGLGIEEEIKRQLSIESTASSQSKEKAPSRTASIFRPFGRAFRKKGKGKEKEKEKDGPREELGTDDGEDEMNRGRSWNEDDGDNLLLSRPTPQSRDMSLPPPLLNSRQASQNDLDIFNRASGANPSQQSRISGERSSGSNSGSAVSNYGGGLSGSGTGTAATSVSGDLNTPRKSLSQNRPTFSSTVGGLKSASEVSLPIESRASSELDHSFNSFARPGTFRTSNQQGLGSASAQRNGEPAGRSSTSSDGRRSLDRLKEFSAARVASSISSEDDADDDEGSERENPAKRQARRAARRKVRGAGVEGSEEEIMAGSSQQGSDPHSRFQRPLRRITSRNNGFTPSHSVPSSSPVWSKDSQDPAFPSSSQQGSDSANSSPSQTKATLPSQSNLRGKASTQSPVPGRASLGASRPSEKSILGAGPGNRSASGPTPSVSSGGSGEKEKNGGGRMAAFSKFLSPKDDDEGDYPVSTLPTSSAILGMGSFMNPVYSAASGDKDSDFKIEPNSQSQRSISKKSLKKKQLQAVSSAAASANNSDREFQSNDLSPTAAKSLVEEQEDLNAAAQKPKRSIFSLGLSRKPSVSVGGNGRSSQAQSQSAFFPSNAEGNFSAASSINNLPSRDFSPTASQMSSSPRPSTDLSPSGTRRPRRRPRTSGGEASSKSGDSWNNFSISRGGGGGVSRSRQLSIASGGALSDKETMNSAGSRLGPSSPRGFVGGEFMSDQQSSSASALLNSRPRRDSVVSLDGRPRSSSGLRDPDPSFVTPSRLESGGGAAALFGTPRQRASSLLPVFSFGRNRSTSNGSAPNSAGLPHTPSTVTPTPDSPSQPHNPMSAIAASIAANDVEAMESMRRSSTTFESHREFGGPPSSLHLFPQAQPAGLMVASPTSSLPPSPAAQVGSSSIPSPSGGELSSPVATTSFFPPSTTSGATQDVPVVSKKKEPSILSPGPKESPSAYARRIQNSVPKSEVAAILASSGDDFAIAALRFHMRKYLFAGNPLDIALRKLLMDMRLPKETQQIDRTMEAFARRYMECNDGLFASEDQPYILAFSLMMLHTDAFNKNAKNKMSKSDYLKNTSSSGVPTEILEYLFDNLTLTEFIYVDDSSDLQKRLTDSDSPSTPNVFNTIGGGSGSPARSRIDPYHLIVTGRTSQFRPEIEALIPEDSPYSTLGAEGDVEVLRKSFLAAPWIEIATARPTVPTGAAWNGTDYQTSAMMTSFAANEPPDTFVTLKITQAGLVSRKDDVVEGSKKARSRKWTQFGMLLTSAQLLFFKDTTWVNALSMQIAKQHREAEMVGQDLSGGFPIHPRVTSFKPDLVLSLSDTIAVKDATYSKYDHVFRLIVNQNSAGHGKQYLIQVDRQSDVDEWVSKINYRAGFRRMGIDIRGLHYDKTKERNVGGGGSDDISMTTSSPPLGPTTPSSPESAKFDTWSKRPSLSSSASSMTIGLWQRRLLARKALVEPKLNQARQHLVKISREVEEEMRLARHLSILTPFQKSTRDRIEAAAVPLAHRLRIKRLQLAQASSVVDVIASDFAHTESEIQSSLMAGSSLEITSEQMDQALKAPSSQLGTPQLIEMGGQVEQEDFDQLFGAAAIAAAATSNAGRSPASSTSVTAPPSRRGSTNKQSSYPPRSRSTRASHGSTTPAQGPAPSAPLPSLPSNDSFSVSPSPSTLATSTSWATKKPLHLHLPEGGLNLPSIDTSMLPQPIEAGQETPTLRPSGEAQRDATSFLSMPNSSGYDSSASDSPVHTRFTRQLPSLPTEANNKGKGNWRATGLAEGVSSSSEAEKGFAESRSDSDIEPTEWNQTRAARYPESVSLVDLNLDLPFDRTLQRRIKTPPSIS